MTKQLIGEDPMETKNELNDTGKMMNLHMVIELLV
jgi:hypothetical protein